MRSGHECVVYNRTDKVKQLESEAGQLPDEFVASINASPCCLMVPAGVVTEQMVMELAQKMEPGDIIIDGGNSYYKDDVRRAKFLQELGIHYLDVNQRWSGVRAATA